MVTECHYSVVLPVLPLPHACCFDQTSFSGALLHEVSPRSTATLVRASEEGMMQLLTKLHRGQSFAKLLLAPELPVEHGMEPPHRDAESGHAEVLYRRHRYGTHIYTHDYCIRNYRIVLLVFSA